MLYKVDSEYSDFQKWVLKKTARAMRTTQRTYLIVSSFFLGLLIFLLHDSGLSDTVVLAATFSIGVLCVGWCILFGAWLIVVQLGGLAALMEWVSDEGANGKKRVLTDEMVED